MSDLGSVPASSTIYIGFTTHAQTGAAVAPSTAFEAADVRIYKNGSATQRSSEAGYTMTSPFDSITGGHQLAIDLADNTDSGFFSVGAFYQVWLVPDETVDGLAAVRVIGTFRIVAAEAIAGKPKVDVDAWLGTAAATPTVAGVPEVDVTHVAGTAQTAGDLKASLNTIDDFLDTEVAAILAAVDTEVATIVAFGAPPTAASIADAVWDEDATAHQTGGTFGQAIGDPGASTETLFKAIITDPAGTNIAADVIAIKAETVEILADTDDIGVAGAGLTALATQASVNTIDDLLDTEIGALTTAVADLPTNAELATALGTADDATLAAISVLDGKVDTIDNFLDTEIAAIKAVTDALTAAAATKLAAAGTGLVTGASGPAATTTSVPACTGFTEATDDHFNGRLMTFTSGVLLGQQTDITDYTGATQTFTVTAFTEAPAEGDTFVIS